MWWVSLDQDRSPRPALNKQSKRCAQESRPLDETGGPMARPLPLASRPESAYTDDHATGSCTRHPLQTGGHQGADPPAQGVGKAKRGVAMVMDGARRRCWRWPRAHLQPERF